LASDKLKITVSEVKTLFIYLFIYYLFIEQLRQTRDVILQ